MSQTTDDDALTVHGCQVRGRWQWTVDGSTGRFSRQQQAYRPSRYFIGQETADPFNDKFGMVVSKLKIRGKGQAVQMEYESEDGKDFQLVGYAMVVTGGGNV